MDNLDAASMHRGRVWMEELIRVPLARTQEVVRNFHDGSTSGHWGTAKTLDLLARRFIFPRVRPIVEEYIRSCTGTRRQKRTRNRPVDCYIPLCCPFGGGSLFPWIGPWFPLSRDMIVFLQSLTEAPKLCI